MYVCQTHFRQLHVYTCSSLHVHVHTCTVHVAHSQPSAPKLTHLKNNDVRTSSLNTYVQCKMTHMNAHNKQLLFSPEASYMWHQRESQSLVARILPVSVQTARHICHPRRTCNNNCLHLSLFKCYYSSNLSIAISTQSFTPMYTIGLYLQSTTLYRTHTHPQHTHILYCLALESRCLGLGSSYSQAGQAAIRSGAGYTAYSQLPQQKLQLDYVMLHQTIHYTLDDLAARLS